MAPTFLQFGQVAYPEFPEHVGVWIGLKEVFYSVLYFFATCFLFVFGWLHPVFHSINRFTYVHPFGTGIPLLVLGLPDLLTFTHYLLATISLRILAHLGYTRTGASTQPTSDSPPSFWTRLRSPGSAADGYRSYAYGAIMPEESRRSRELARWPTFLLPAVLLGAACGFWGLFILGRWTYDT